MQSSEREMMGALPKILGVEWKVVGELKIVLEMELACHSYWLNIDMKENVNQELVLGF